MRGLQIRSNYALAQVQMIIDCEGGSDDLMDVCIDAEQQGRSEYLAGHDEPPLLFAGAPELVQAWHNGWHSAAEYAEMAVCTECNNGTGNPCPFHG